MNKCFLIIVLISIPSIIFSNKILENYESYIYKSITKLSEYEDAINTGLTYLNSNELIGKKKRFYNSVVEDFKTYNINPNTLHIENNLNPRLFCNYLDCIDKTTIEVNKVPFIGKNEYRRRLLLSNVLEIKFSNQKFEVIDLENKYIFISFESKPISKKSKVNFESSKRVAVFRIINNEIELYRIKFLTKTLDKDIQDIFENTFFKRIDYFLDNDDFKTALTLISDNKKPLDKIKLESYKDKAYLKAFDYYDAKINSSIQSNNLYLARSDYNESKNILPIELFSKFNKYIDEIEKIELNNEIQELYSDLNNCQINKAQSKLSAINRKLPSNEKISFEIIENKKIECLESKVSELILYKNEDELIAVYYELYSLTGKQKYKNEIGKIYREKFKSFYSLGKESSTFQEQNKNFIEAYNIKMKSDGLINTNKAELQIFKNYLNKSDGLYKSGKSLRGNHDLLAANKSFSEAKDLLQYYQRQRYFLERRAGKVLRTTKRISKKQLKVSSKIDKLKKRGGLDQVYIYKYRYQSRKAAINTLYFGVSLNVFKSFHNKNLSSNIKSSMNDFDVLSNQYSNYFSKIDLSSIALNINYKRFGVYISDFIYTDDFKQYNVGGYLKLYKYLNFKMGYTFYKGDLNKLTVNSFYQGGLKLNTNNPYYFGLSIISPMFQLETGYNLYNNTVDLKLGVNIWFRDAFIKKDIYKDSSRLLKYYKKEKKKRK